jgi:hypothetical protein
MITRPSLALPMRSVKLLLGKDQVKGSGVFILIFTESDGGDSTFSTKESGVFNGTRTAGTGKRDRSNNRVGGADRSIFEGDRRLSRPLLWPRREGTFCLFL